MNNTPNPVGDAVLSIVEAQLTVDMMLDGTLGTLTPPPCCQPSLTACKPPASPWALPDGTPASSDHRAHGGHARPVRC